MLYIQVHKWCWYLKMWSDDAEWRHRWHHECHRHISADDVIDDNKYWMIEFKWKAWWNFILRRWSVSWCNISHRSGSNRLKYNRDNLMDLKVMIRWSLGEMKDVGKCEEIFLQHDGTRQFWLDWPWWIASMWGQKVVTSLWHHSTFQDLRWISQVLR